MQPFKAVRLLAQRGCLAPRTTGSDTLESYLRTGWLRSSGRSCSENVVLAFAEEEGCSTGGPARTP